jgi:hypothetical protein
LAFVGSRIFSGVAVSQSVLLLIAMWSDGCRRIGAMLAPLAHPGECCTQFATQFARQIAQSHAIGPRRATRELGRWIIYGILLAGTNTQTTQSVTIAEGTALVFGQSGD